MDLPESETDETDFEWEINVTTFAKGEYMKQFSLCLDKWLDFISKNLIINIDFILDDISVNTSLKFVRNFKERHGFIWN